MQSGFLLPFAALALWGQISSTPSASAWVGKFSGDGLEIEFRQAPPNGLTATLVFGGKSYTATGSLSAGTFAGTFRDGDASFPFESTLTGDRLLFTTAGTEYRLTRAVTSSPNPLARNNPTRTPFRHSLGFSLQLPPGWSGTEAPDSALLLPSGVTFDPKRLDNPEVYIAALRNDYTPQDEAQTVAQFSAAISRDQPVSNRNGQREPATFGTRSGSIYRWDIRGRDTGRLVAFDIYLAPEGPRAYVIVAAGEQSLVRSRDSEVRQILSSMAPTQVNTAANNNAPLADSTPLAQRWLAKLRGKMIRQFWASQGMSSDKRHLLAADGTYSFRSSSMVSVDVSGASALSTGKDNTTGRWRIRDSGGQLYLEVTYNNGTVSRMPITENGQNWFLNGEKAFAVDPE
jgi:hypothetical protein